MFSPEQKNTKGTQSYFIFTYILQEI